MGPIQGSDYQGFNRTLVYKGTGRPVHQGDKIPTTPRGTVVTVNGGRPPHKAGSTGRVWTDHGEYFPHVFDLEWTR